MSCIEEHAEELLSGKPFPKSPEQFLSERGIYAPDLETLLTDYRTHLEDVWGQRVQMHAKEKDVDDQYRKAMHDLNGHDPE